MNRSELAARAARLSPLLFLAALTAAQPAPRLGYDPAVFQAEPAAGCDSRWSREADCVFLSYAEPSRRRPGLNASAAVISADTALDDAELEVDAPPAPVAPTLPYDVAGLLAGDEQVSYRIAPPRP